MLPNITIEREISIHTVSMSVFPDVACDLHVLQLTMHDNFKATPWVL